LRRTQIKLQVALITPLLHVKGYNAPETKAAMERARLLMEQAAALGEPAEDPLLLFSVLYGFWAARTVAFNGEGIRALAAQFLALAQKQGSTVPLVIGHRLMGTSLMSTGDIAEGRAHCDRALALYDPAAHRALAMGFGHDARVGILCYRPFASWMLGYPGAAHADADQALKDAHEIGHAATLLIALYYAPATYLLCGDYQAATAVSNELLALAEEKASVQWKFLSHGSQQEAHVKVVDATFPGLQGLGESFTVMEEWYSLKNFSKDNHVLLALETAGMRLPSAHCNHGKRHQQGAGPARRCQNGRRITTICNPRKLQELELDLKKNQQSVEAIAKDIADCLVVLRTAADRLAPDGEQQEWEGKSHVGAHGRRESRIAMGGQGPRPAMRAA
jgi:tetratricopeptide (TPR) repeat protein